MKRGQHTLMIFAAAATPFLLAQPAARAQHGHTILVESDSSGGGQLQLRWDFEGMPIARTADSGLAGVFTGNVPGLNDGAGDGSTLFPLTDGTEIDAEVTAMDESIRWIFGEGPMVPIEEPFGTAPVGTMPTLHNHATFEITTDDDNTFTEGRISFRVFDSSPTPVYSHSDVRTLIVSNGYLPPFETATAGDLNCQKAVAGAVRIFAAKAYQSIGRCIDAVLSHTLLSKKATPALSRCGIDESDTQSLTSKLAAEKEKAIAMIVRKCGMLDDSSTRYTASQIHTHLGMARCRAEEMAGATYNHAAQMIGEVLEAEGLGDHHDVQHAFPCMKASIE